MKILRVFCIVLSFVLTFFLISLITAGELNGEEWNQMSVGSLQDRIDEYLGDLGIELGAEDETGKFFYLGTSTVSVHASDADWGRARVVAFERAILNAQKDFLRDHFGRHFTKKTEEMFADASSDAEIFPENLPTDKKMVALWDKIVVLGEAYIDEKISNYDIDPSEYDARPLPQKKQLLYEHLVHEILMNAVGDVNGMLPFKTFEETDSDGTSKIAVLMVYSPALKQLAYDISRERAPLLRAKPGKSYREIINLKEEKLVNEFGVRLVFDQEGRPNLLSFGQWSFRYDGTNPRMKSRYADRARSSAASKADAYITEFIVASMMLESQEETGELIEKALIKDSDGFIRRIETENIIDRTWSKVQSRSRATTAGRRTLRNWSYTHPNGQEIVGVIRVWTPDLVTSSREVRDWQPETRAISPTLETADPEEEEEKDYKSVTESLEVMDIDTGFICGKTIEKKGITAIGEGNSRTEAIYDGLRQVLMQEKGVNFSSTELARYGYNSLSGIIDEEEFEQTVFSEESDKEILTLTDGYIRGFEILLSDHDPVNRKWTVQLAVTVLDYRAPGLSPDSRYTIALLPFRTSSPIYRLDDQTVHGQSLAQRLGDQIIDHITQTHRFTVLDRDYAEAYFSEKDLLLSGDAGIEQQARLARVLGADFLLTGVIENALITTNERISEITQRQTFYTEGVFTVNYRVIVMATRQIQLADTVNIRVSDSSFNQRMSSEERASHIFAQIAQSITNNIIETIYPIRIVHLQEDGTFALNQGGNSVREGDIFEVYELGEVMVDPYTGEPLGKDEKLAGQIKVTRVTPKMSYAIVIDGGPDFEIAKSICRRISGKVGTELEGNERYRQPTIQIDSAGGVRMPFD